MPIDIQDIEAAQERIKPYVLETPLLRAPCLDDDRCEVFLKCENFQRTRSFKVRGAANRLLGCLEQAQTKGVVTRSSGNFAQALAWMARELGVAATIVMPENTSELKRLRTKALCADLRIKGGSSREADEYADRIAVDEGKIRMSAYDDIEVISGQGTAGLEIVTQLSSFDYYFCPVGGGGLMSGTAVAIKHFVPHCRVVAVEPEGANDYFLSREQGYKITLERVETCADGLRTATVGENTYPLLNRGVDEVLTVSDEQIVEAQSRVFDQLGMMIEPSAAVSVAGLLTYQADLSEPSTKLRAVAMLSGGNI